MLLTGHLNAGKLLMSGPVQDKRFQAKPSIHISLSGGYFEARFGCPDILIVGKSPITLRQRATLP